MKRAVMGVILTLSLTLGLFGTPGVAQAGQVFCRVPTAHKVVCYNYTPYAVYMRVTVRTSAGPRYFAFWNYYTKWTKYFAPTVYSVSWRWRF